MTNFYLMVAVLFLTLAYSNYGISGVKDELKEALKLGQQFAKKIENIKDQECKIPSSTTVGSESTFDPMTVGRGSYDEKERYLVVQTSLGLFNRVSLMASAYAWASLTKRKLIINWETQEGHMPALFGQLFSGPKLTTPNDMGTEFKEKLSKFLKNVEDYKGNDTLLIATKWMTISGANSVHVPLEDEQSNKLINDLYLTCQGPTPIVYLTGVGAIIPRVGPSYSDFDEQYKKFYSLLKPLSSVEEATENFYEKNLKGKRVVSIHYRAFSPDVEIKSFAYLYDKRTPVRVFMQEMDRALANDSKTVFFIATDNRKSLKEFEQKYPGRIFSYPHSSVARNTPEGQANALIDWKLLQKGEYIIGSKESTFSDEASVTLPKGKVAVGKEILVMSGTWGGPVSRKKEVASLGLKRAIKDTKIDHKTLLKEGSELYSRLPSYAYDVQLDLLKFALENPSPMTPVIQKHFADTFILEEDYTRTVDMACRNNHEKLLDFLTTIKGKDPLRDTFIKNTVKICLPDSLMTEACKRIAKCFLLGADASLPVILIGEKSKFICVNKASSHDKIDINNYIFCPHKENGLRKNDDCLVQEIYALTENKLEIHDADKPECGLVYKYDNTSKVGQFYDRSSGPSSTVYAKRFGIKIDNENKKRELVEVLNSASLNNETRVAQYLKSKKVNLDSCNLEESVSGVRTRKFLPKRPEDLDAKGVKEQTKFMSDATKKLINLHQQGICHGNINAENVRLDDNNQIVFNNFNNSMLSSDTKMSYIGAISGIPNKSGYEGEYSSFVQCQGNDFYALGNILRRTIDRYTPQCSTDDSGGEEITTGEGYWTKMENAFFCSNQECKSAITATSGYLPLYNFVCTMLGGSSDEERIAAVKKALDIL
ncbi:MAG: hypothetical protein HQK51_12505 [Oligoflexia bacterium]|nr:hypothetical protein [Oligoflexia bacterium]